jgi:tetratricopeptide (TPR) repeat protein
MCEQYLKHEPTDGAVWAWYGHTLVHLGRYSEAGAALQTARGLVTRDDVRGFVLGCQGDLEETQGHYPRAEEFYREAVDCEGVGDLAVCCGHGRRSSSPASLETSARHRIP